MKPFLLFTQNECPNCDLLKRMLAGPLKGRHDDQIEVVHRETDPGRFTELSEQHGVQSTPTLLRAADGERLKRFGLGEVRGFLEAGLALPADHTENSGV